MCPKCNNTGIVRKETYSGVITTDGCTCEVAKQQQASYQERWNAWLKRFESWERGLQREQRVG
ncbi:hypothetical protein [Bacillus sp. UNC322MFChir4.1]|uniref:hypothetical protein n=1 Tax=Bacillus sp. UNC322MFChir4.1 TaxID=1449045 RepID=UPI0005508F01|nr:hypothetical protein [Bacillus sp. UNC322MFChir4.1]